LPVTKTIFGDRVKCYKCYRPKSICLCDEVFLIDTKTKFIILMHPKEFKKVKNGTGHLTHLSLSNSKLFVGIDFTNHNEVNKIISTHDSYVLYPSDNALNLSNTKLSIKKDRNKAIFIIDSTWSCSVKILRDSKNLQSLTYLSFDNTKLSQFKIKEQPAPYCLSTIESTLSVLELLNKQKIENIDNENMIHFLNPFKKMIDYQLKYVGSLSSSVRFKVN